MEARNTDSDKEDGEEEAENSPNGFGNDFKRQLKRIRFWVEVFALVGLGFYVCETHRTNSLTQQALNKSDEHFRAEQRPWIIANPRFSGIETVTDPVTKKPNIRDVPFIKVGDDLYRIMIAIEVANTGHSPALNAVFTTSQVLVGPTSDVRQKVVSWTPQWRDDSTILATQVAPVTVGAEDGPTINNIQGLMVKSGQWEVYVVGAIKYEDVVGPSSPPYETVYCFQYKPEGMPFGVCTIKPIVLH